MIENTPCTECIHVGRRTPDQDASDSLAIFKAYYCKAFKIVVHDYYTVCKCFETNPSIASK